MAHRTIGALSTLILLTALALVLYLNLTGSCYSELRYVPTQELMDIAIDYNLRKHYPSSERTKIYSSKEAFHNVNPNCCSLRHDPRTAYDILGFYQTEVEILYQIKDRVPDAFYLSYVYVNACGQMRGARGTPQEKGPHGVSAR
jgi:hypothetical protein